MFSRAPLVGRIFSVTLLFLENRIRYGSFTSFVQHVFEYSIILPQRTQVLRIHHHWFRPVLEGVYGVCLTLPTHIFPSKWILEHVTSRVCGDEFRINKINLTLTLNLLLPSYVFHNKTCVFIMVFTVYSQLIFYMKR